MKRWSFILTLGFIFLVGMSARLAFVQLPGNYDQASYRIVTSIMEHQGNIYAETSRYNYSPLWAFALQAMANLANHYGVALDIVVRCMLSLIDCINALLIGAIFRQRLLTFAYLLNPVAILLVGYHGQFETFAAFPLLLGVLLITKTPDARWIFWLLATCALLIKHIFIFHVWVAFVTVARTRRQALLLMCLSLGVWLASFIPYLPEGLDGIIQNVFLYRGIAGVYGVSSLLPPFIGLILFLVIMGTLPFWLPTNSILFERMTICGVLLLTLIPGIGIQYFIIPLFFGTISPGYLWYTCWCTLLILASPNNIHILNLVPIWNYAWIGILGWIIYLLLLPMKRVQTRL